MSIPSIGSFNVGSFHINLQTPKGRREALGITGGASTTLAIGSLLTGHGLITGGLLGLVGAPIFCAAYKISERAINLFVPATPRESDFSRKIRTVATIALSMVATIYAGAALVTALGFPLTFAPAFGFIMSIATLAITIHWLMQIAPAPEPSNQPAANNSQPSVFRPFSGGGNRLGHVEAPVHPNVNN